MTDAPGRAKFTFMKSPDRIVEFVDTLRESQSWPPEKMRAYQEQLLAKSLRHASETVPFYRDRLAPLFFAGDGDRAGTIGMRCRS